MKENVKEWKIFIGSSSEKGSEDVMETVALSLEEISLSGHRFIPQKWTGCFPAGEYTLESLVDTCKKVDLAIFIYAEDDKILLNDNNYKSITRANVVFEHGLFMGAFGCIKEKAIAVATTEEILRNMQSDVKGITVIRYDEGKKNTFTKELKTWLEKRISEKDNSISDNPICENHAVGASIVETGSSNDKRDYEFASLTQEAKNGDELCVMGMGVTNFLNNEQRMNPLLNKGVKVEVLLMFNRIIRNDWMCRFEHIFQSISPENNNEIRNDWMCRFEHIFQSISPENNNEKSKQNGTKCCPVSIANILIDEQHFGKYQKKDKEANKDYIDKMKTAFNNCIKFKKSYKNFDFSCFFSFIPMSMTAIKGKKMIVEYIIPFTKNRILIKISYSKDKEIFDTFMNFYDSVAKESKKARQLNNAKSGFDKIIVTNNK